MLIDFPNWIAFVIIYLIYFLAILLLLSVIVILSSVLYEKLSKMKYFISTVFYVISRKIRYDNITNKYYFTSKNKEYYCEFKEAKND